MEKSDHKDDIDLITIKCISYIQDLDNSFESKDNQIEIPSYSPFSSSSNSSSSSASSTSSTSSNSPTLKRKKFTEERSVAQEVSLKDTQGARSCDKNERANTPSSQDLKTQQDVRVSRDQELNVLQKSRVQSHDRSQGQSRDQVQDQSQNGDRSRDPSHDRSGSDSVFEIHNFDMSSLDARYSSYMGLGVNVQSEIVRHEIFKLKNQNNPNDPSELCYTAVHCKTNILQIRFGILRRVASFISIPTSIISENPNTYSAALYLQSYKALDNDSYSFLLVGELFNVEIHNSCGYSIFFNSVNGNVRKRLRILLLVSKDSDVDADLLQSCSNSFIATNLVYSNDTCYKEAFNIYARWSSKNGVFLNVVNGLKKILKPYKYPRMSI